MSMESIALFRKNLGLELGKLAEQRTGQTMMIMANGGTDCISLHQQISNTSKNYATSDLYNLRQSDRDALQNAANTVRTHTAVGSVLGVALGVFLAYRLRTNRAAMFRTFRANTAEHPVAVKFAGGREEAIPDLTPLLKPSTLGDVATYSLLGAGGLFFGGETGLLTGTLRARQRINSDRESRMRIESAYRKFQADALRTQANMIEDMGASREGNPNWGL